MTTTSEPRSIVSVQLRADDLERLRALARESDRSVSAEIRRAIQAHVTTERELA
jgi:predicted transcriptional regulator